MDELKSKDLDQKTIFDIVTYAHRLTRGNPLGHSGTLGNVTIRMDYGRDWVCYAKQMGISLEEMDTSHVSVKSLDNTLLYGEQTSEGIILNLEIFKHRPDVNAAIHLHPSSVVSFFSAYTKIVDFPYISNWAPRELGCDPLILQPEVNIEMDVAKVEDIIPHTDVIIMPPHGVTTVGSTVGEAYNRMTVVVNEVKVVGDYLRNCAALQVEPEFLEREFVLGEYETYKRSSNV